MLKLNPSFFFFLKLPSTQNLTHIISPVSRTFQSGIQQSSWRLEPPAQSADWSEWQHRLPQAFPVLNLLLPFSPVASWAVCHMASACDGYCQTPCGDQERAFHHATALKRHLLSPLPTQHATCACSFSCLCLFMPLHSRQHWEQKWHFG